MAYKQELWDEAKKKAGLAMRKSACQIFSEN